MWIICFCAAVDPCFASPSDPIPFQSVSFEWSRQSTAQPTQHFSSLAAIDIASATALSGLRSVPHVSSLEPISPNDARIGFPE